MTSRGISIGSALLAMVVASVVYFVATGTLYLDSIDSSTSVSTELPQLDNYDTVINWLDTKCYVWSTDNATQTEAVWVCEDGRAGIWKGEITLPGAPE